MTTPFPEHRTYGVELETQRPSGVSNTNVCDRIRAAGIPCTVGHSHTSRNEPGKWLVKPDGSIRPYGQGAEIVSPILVGSAGFDQIERVCAAAGGIGLRITSECGLHVHVGAADVMIAPQRKLAVVYSDHEVIIDSLMPLGRRGSSNTYCKSIKNATHAQIANATRTSDLAMVLAGYSSSRYSRSRHNLKFYKVNFSSHWHRRTIEFRHHSGTINARKVINWVKFCVRMVQHAHDHPTIVIGGRTVSRPMASWGENARGGQAIFRALLLRPEGATRDEIFAATGWHRGSLSMRNMARLAGIELRSSRVFGSKAKRYYGAIRGAEVVIDAAAPMAPPAPTFDGLMDMIGCEPPEVEYWVARRNELAQRHGQELTP